MPTDSKEEVPSKQAIAAVDAVTNRIGLNYTRAARGPRSFLLNQMANYRQRYETERRYQRLMYDLVTKYGVRVKLLELAGLYSSERVAKRMLMRLVRSSCDMARAQNADLSAVDMLERSVLAFEAVHERYLQTAHSHLPPTSPAEPPQTSWKVAGKAMVSRGFRRAAEIAMRFGSNWTKGPLRAPAM